MSAMFDRISDAPNFDELPIAMQQSNSPAATAWRMVLLGPAVVLLAAPLLVGAQVAGEPGGLSAVLGQPFSALQVLGGFLVWAAMLAVPLTRTVRRMGTRRAVTIDPKLVCVEEKSLGGTHLWSAPLASYRGIAHHVRTSLSGARHELILVHPDPSRNVLLAVADRMNQSTLDKAKALLGLPEIPARTIYERMPRALRVEPQPASELAAARG